MLFKNIIGHTHLKKKILALPTQSTTLLFNGPKGSAALPLSLAYATYMHCTSPSSTDACGQCDHCTKMLRITHPDLHFAFPIGKTPQIKSKELTTKEFMSNWQDFLQNHPYGDIKDWSESLQNEAKKLQIGKPQVQQIKKIGSLSPLQSHYNIILIWLPEYLHPSAANALLKILEEPNRQTVFILVTHNLPHLLPTVSSRALKIYTPPFKDKDILQALEQQHPKLKEKERSLLVQLAQGNLNKAYQLAQGNQKDYLTHFNQWLRAIYTQNWSNLVTLTEILCADPLQTQKTWLIYSLHIIRGTLLTTYGRASLAPLKKQEMDLCQKLSKAFTPDQLQKMVSLIEQTHQSLDRYAHSKLTFLYLAIKIIDLLKK